MAESRLSTLKQYVFVIWELSRKEHKRKTNETNLGVVWNVLNPLLYMIILSTYYQNVIIHDVDNFPVFVFTGITMLNYYTVGTTGAMRCIVENKNLLIKSQVSLQVFIFQKVFIAFKEMCFSAIALIPIMWFYKIPLSGRTILIIPVLILTTGVVVGIGEILSIAYVYFSDIDYLYSVFMTLMFFVSGVFIPLERMPEQMQRILTYNPIFLSIYLVRSALIYNQQSHWHVWVKLLIWAVFFTSLGFVFINKKSDYMNRL